MMEALIHSADYTPSEMRMAAIMASINYEMHRLPTITITVRELEDALRTVSSYAEGS